MHTPVLLNEVIEALSLKKGSVVIDGTLGLGGHSEKILEYIIPNGLLIGIDQDTRNIKEAKKKLKAYEKNTKIVHDNFRNIEEVLKKLKVKKVDGILLDLGLSSVHVDKADRGFSFQSDGPLDMRMNSEQEITAATIVNSYTEKDLADVIYEYGEERMSRRIARSIVEKRKIQKFQTTRELAIVIESVIKQKHTSKHPALLTFQALRIAVNDELNALESVLEQSMGLLSLGGRLAVISYHSLEDRMVKHFFRKQARQCICPKESPLCTCHHSPQLNIITKRPIRPTDKEISENPRARSGKMRVAERMINE
ncbi:16S rRNA (cytosine(1402)-N(4))-methyltransferase RsmH [Candidatus Peregrinibacteria bacterium]|jgi:16S rRNA (cytosine1402-N4)-methyltransferase|nr:16S rRNA (cytosine(1402)-N(4))-methyltransferase RsmH [Candidatus Peregrinibacteria bacterium]